MENNIPTAGEFLTNYLRTNGIIFYTPRDVKQAMIEFAKLHVEAALKQASEKAYYRDFNEYVCRSEENKQSILNSYPLTNIK
jgi:prophage maintenance system killer protein